MAEKTIKFLRKLLFPLKYLYALIVGSRNLLFNIGLLETKSYDFPLISVGNITAGGTGKTPHVEYLIRLLQEKNKLAVLSRGYNRHTKGLIFADESSDSSSLGDEPFQIYTKFRDKISVVVDANRRRALDVIFEDYQGINLVLLDDAYQHRYVKVGLSILLVDYNRPIYSDQLLPVGNLREAVSEKKRANLILVTKCPKNLTQLEARVIRNKLTPAPYQSLYFSCYEYDEIKSLIVGGGDKILSQISSVFLLTAIASPKSLIQYLEIHTTVADQLSFSDHHYFTKADWVTILKRFSDLSDKNKVIITTEKDAARMLIDDHLPVELLPFIYIIPLRVRILMNGETSFNTKILSYVEKNKRDREFPKR